MNRYSNPLIIFKSQNFNFYFTQSSNFQGFLELISLKKKNWPGGNLNRIPNLVIFNAPFSLYTKCQLVFQTGPSPSQHSQPPYAYYAFKGSFKRLYDEIQQQRDCNFKVPSIQETKRVQASQILSSIEDENLCEAADNVLKSYATILLTNTEIPNYTTSEKLLHPFFITYLIAKTSFRWVNETYSNHWQENELKTKIEEKLDHNISWLFQDCLAYHSQLFHNDLKDRDTIIPEVFFPQQKGIEEIIPSRMFKLKEGLLYMTSGIDNYFLRYTDSILKTRSKKVLTIQNNKHPDLYDPPIIILNNERNQLGVISNKEEAIVLDIYTIFKEGKLVKKYSRSIPDIDGVVDACFGDNNSIYLSSYVDFQTDIFRFDYLRAKLSQITDDYHDEGKLHYIENTGLLFETTSLTDTIQPFNENFKMDTSHRMLFLSNQQLSDLENEKATELIAKPIFERIQGSIDKITQGSNDTITFLNNHNGIYNVYAFRFNEQHTEFEPLPLTNSPISISEYELTKDGIESFIANETSIYRQFTNRKSLVDLKESAFMHELQSIIQKEKDLLYKARDTSGIHFFKPEFKEITKLKDTLSTQPYKLEFYRENVKAGLDNSIWLNSYQPYSMNQGLFRQPQLGGLIRFNLREVFRDYALSFAFRIPNDIKGSDYFVNFENTKHQISWRLSYMRHVERFTMPFNKTWYNPQGYYFPPNIKLKTHLGQLEVLYPFTLRKKLSLTLGARHDRSVFLALDSFSLQYPDTMQIWSFARIQFDIDHVKEISAFSHLGYRIQTFMEYNYQLKEKQTGFSHVGMDIRWYKRIFGNTIWAQKISGAMSFGGTLGVMYTLGGSQGQLGPITDTSIHYNQNDNYSYVTYATNLRGYLQNIRSGNTYFISNTELRIPILQLLTKRRFSLESINNLQVVPFFDVGNAWKYPRLSNRKIPSFAAGYGCGFRTNLLGYFVRMDIAWTNRFQINQRKPAVIFGLGTAF